MAEPTTPCCDYRDHRIGGCFCPDHDRSDLHPMGAVGDEMTKYERQLEDACLVLWAELPAAEVQTLRAVAPALVEFLRHLHESIEHQQAMVRTNVWADAALTEGGAG